jgi:hypothetical protein
MNSSANREGISVIVRVALFVVSLTLTLTFVVGGVSAREDLPRPYVQPGDGDGPAGISESVSHKVLEDNSMPICLTNNYENNRDASVFLITFKSFLNLQVILSTKKGN